MNITGMFANLADGLKINILVTVTALFLPLVLGILLSVLASLHKVVADVFKWLSLPFEIICPPVIIIALFYIPGLLLGQPVFSRIVCLIIGLTLAFMGYMPARYNSKRSLIYNILYNGVGLIQTVFTWSFISRVVMVTDMLKVAEKYCGSNATTIGLFAVLGVTVMVLGFLEILKRVFDQFIK